MTFQFTFKIFKKICSFVVGDGNCLAKMKLESRKRKDEFHHKQRLIEIMKKDKPEALQEMFVIWTGDRSTVISLSLVWIKPNLYNI